MTRRLAPASRTSRTQKLHARFIAGCSRAYVQMQMSERGPYEESFHVQAFCGNLTNTKHVTERFQPQPTCQERAQCRALPPFLVGRSMVCLSEGGDWYVPLVCPYDVRTVSIRRPYDVRAMSRRMSVVCPWYVPFTPDVRCFVNLAIHTRIISGYSGHLYPTLFPCSQ